MKGRLSTRFIILLVLGIIVLALALAVGGKFINLTGYFPSTEKERLMNYLTCQLAKCAIGCGSETDAICLDTDESFNCVKWCSTKDTCARGTKDCGGKINLELNSQVNLNSGDLQTYRNWVCTCALGGCIGTSCVGLGCNSPCYMRVQCFLHGAPWGYTPILSSQEYYPSAIFLDKTFAEKKCVIEYRAPIGTIKLTNCQFDKEIDGQKASYNIWVSHTIPATGLYGCAAVTIEPTTQIFKPPFSFSTPEPVVQTSLNEFAPSVVEYNGKLYVFYHAGISSKIINNPQQTDIYYITFDDGKWSQPTKITDSASTGYSYAYPSAAIFNGKLYISYSQDVGTLSWKISHLPGSSGWEIFVMNFETKEAKQITTPNNVLDGGSKLIVDNKNNKMYVFYHHQPSLLVETTDVYYTTATPVATSYGITFGSSTKLGLQSTALYPSSTFHVDNLYLSYSALGDITNLFTGGWEIFTRKFDGSTWQYTGRVTNNQLVDGNSQLFSDGDSLFVFYHEGTGDAENNPTGSPYNIFYNQYLGGTTWSDTFPGVKGVKPSIIYFKDSVYLLFSTYTTNWDIYYSISEFSPPSPEE